MNRPRLMSKSFGSFANSEKACREFTISAECGGKHFSSILSIVIFALTAVAFSKMDCLNKKNCQPREIIYLVLPALVLLIYFANYLTAVSKETLLFVIPLGLQMTVIPRVGKANVTWIPWGSIKHFMILDVIIGQKVIFCLAVALDDGSDSEKTLILFRNTKPRLPELEMIYRELQNSFDKYS